MKQPGYVFIVGSIRSGTTLLRRILNCSDDVAICGETSFFVGGKNGQGFRGEFANIGDISTDVGARKVVEYIYHGIEARNFWFWIRDHVAQEEFLRRLLASDRSDRALFDLVMACFAADRPIRGEKTPGHINHVPTLLDWFPRAKILHTFRDPRAVSVSIQERIVRGLWEARPWIRQSALALNLHQCITGVSRWQRIVRLHRQYQQCYPQNYYMLRFEDLIAEPTSVLANLCDYLGIGFVEEMLRQKVINSSFISDDVIVQGFDASATERWRKHMPPWVNRLFLACCKRTLVEFGYQP